MEHDRHPGCVAGEGLGTQNMNATRKRCSAPGMTVNGPSAPGVRAGDVTKGGALRRQRAICTTKPRFDA